MSDPSARGEYIQAHVRRLEAMRRAGHVERNADGSWKIPQDYLKRAAGYERKRGFNNPVKLDIASRAPLKDLTDTIGRTWLDESLSSGVTTEHLSGFGEEVNVAKAQRQKFLLSKGLIGKERRVTAQTLKALVPWRETMDRNLGKSVTGVIKGQTIFWTLTKGRGIA